MRDIKFRVWDTRFEKFVEAGVTRIKSDTGEVAGHRGGGDNVEHWHLEQYTGVKDNNGADIYEGDIIKWGDNIESVIFDDGFFQTETSCLDHCMEVVGNIHQNGNLLSDV